MVSPGDGQDYWVGSGASRKPLVFPVVVGEFFNIKVT